MVDDRRQDSAGAVPGTTQVLPDLLGGRLNIFFGNISNVLPRFAQASCAPLRSVRKRSPEIPELPTMEDWAALVSMPPRGSD